MIIEKTILQQKVLPSVEKPGQYAGNELNSVEKDWASAPARMAFAFPDLYEIGMSHLGMRLLYEAINHHSPHLCERVFLPQPDMAARLRSLQLPLFTLESRHELRDFDLVGFTLQYELSYTNILAMLDLANIPLSAAERGAADPLIIAGGPCAYNPEPLVDCIDLFVIGEGEEMNLDLLDLVAEGKEAGWSRDELLRRAVAIPGVYAPRFYAAQYDAKGDFVGLALTAAAPAATPAVVEKRVLLDFDAAVFPEKPILPNIEPVHDRIMLEVMRGCSRGCRFCQAGMIYRPVREKSMATLLRQAATQASHSGYDDIALLSLSTADYTCVEQLMMQLLAAHAESGVGVSLPSLRVDALSVALASRTQAVRKSGITLAPEAGSQRMRDAINKGVCEEDILSAAAAAFSQGYTHIKLYFMIGLPYETDSDILAIAELVKKIIRVGRENKPADIRKPQRISLGVANFIPKPFTAFQWQGQDSVLELKRKQTLLREAIRPLRQVTLNCHECQGSLLEAAFARGDRRLAPVLRRAYELGCRMDGWSEHFRFDLWQQAFIECGLSMEQFASWAPVYGAPLPWSHISCGVSEAFLWQENIRAGRAELTADCRQGDCSGCGVCQGKLANVFQPEGEKLPPSATMKPLSAEAPVKYRLCLAISEPICWLSHLDLLSALERTLRRSGLPVAYSQGFNPHLLISFGPAHPVGLLSDGEWLDVTCSQPLAAGWEAALQAVLPPGLTLVSGREVPLASPALMAAINLAAYQVRLAEYDPLLLQAAIERFLSAEEVVLERYHPKGKKKVDIRASVLSLVQREDGFACEVALDQGAAVKMPELCALLAPDAVVVEARRSGLFICTEGKRQTP